MPATSEQEWAPHGGCHLVDDVELLHQRTEDGYAFSPIPSYRCAGIVGMESVVATKLSGLPCLLVLWLWVGKIAEVDCNCPVEIVVI